MDPADPLSSDHSQASLAPQDNGTASETTENTPLLRSSRHSSTDSTKSLSDCDYTFGSSSSSTIPSPSSDHLAADRQPLSLPAVMVRLAKSPRALAALAITFSYG